MGLKSSTLPLSQCTIYMQYANKKESKNSQYGFMMMMWTSKKKQVLSHEVTYGSDIINMHQNVSNITWISLF